MGCVVCHQEDPAALDWHCDDFASGQVFVRDFQIMVFAMPVRHDFPQVALAQHLHAANFRGRIPQRQPAGEYQ